MEKWSRYYLSLCIFFSILSCKTEITNNLPAAEKSKISDSLFYEFYVKENTGPIQGSQESMILLEKIINLDSTNCDAIRELSVAYLKRGFPYQWKPIYDRAVRCDAKTWQPWRGYLYLFFYRDYENAIKDFNASDTLTPNFIDAPQGHSVDYWRGFAYLGLEDYRNSSAYFEKHILQVKTDNGEDWVEPSAFLGNAIAHYEQNDQESALENLELAQKYYQNKNADVFYYKALIYLEKNEKENAQKAIENAIQNFKSGNFRHRPYVEEIRQLYYPEYLALQDSIMVR